MDVAGFLRRRFPSQTFIPGTDLTPREVRTNAWSVPEASNSAHDAYDCICAFFLTAGLPPTFDIPIEGIGAAIEDWAKGNGFPEEHVWPLGIPNPVLIPHLFTTKVSWGGAKTVGFADPIQAACTLRILRDDFPANGPARQTHTGPGDRNHPASSAGDTGTTNTGWPAAQTSLTQSCTGGIYRLCNAFHRSSTC